MTLEELYGKILADDELKEGLAKAFEDGKIVEWVSAQGVEASEEEIFTFIKGAANEKLDVDDVDQVAGGGYGSFIKSAWSSVKDTYTDYCALTTIF